MVIPVSREGEVSRSRISPFSSATAVSEFAGVSRRKREEATIATLDCKRKSSLSLFGLNAMEVNWTGKVMQCIMQTGHCISRFKARMYVVLTPPGVRLIRD